MGILVCSLFMDNAGFISSTVVHVGTASPGQGAGRVSSVAGYLGFRGFPHRSGFRQLGLRKGFKQSLCAGPLHGYLLRFFSAA